MAYKYVNPNPARKTVGDCVVRALALALGRSWEDTYVELTMYGFDMCDMPSSNAVWDAMLKDYGYVRGVVEDECAIRCYTVRDFANDNPAGVFVLGTGNHVVAVKNGDYMDTWDSGDEIPLYCYRKGK